MFIKRVWHDGLALPIWFLSERAQEPGVFYKIHPLQVLALARGLHKVHMPEAKFKLGAACIPGCKKMLYLVSF